jgi:transmembrane sensor
LSWREGILYFKQANLAQVVSKLENWYGVTIELTGKIPGREKEWHYTGSYQNQSLDNVLEGIAFVKKFSYEKKGNTVKIKFN